MARIPKPSGRKSRKVRLISYGRHLVYAEGKKTEPLYVENISRIVKENYKYHNTDIIIENVPHTGLNTLGLVRFAEEDVERRLSQRETIDHVWIFYDKDSFSQDDFDNAHNKIINKNSDKHQNDDGDNVDKNNILWHSIWSNECFELWVILHFEYLTAALSRDKYITKINASLSGELYEKNRNDLYDLLLDKGDLTQAIKNAKKLHNDNGLNNPSTGVYLFLEYFDKYLNKT